MRITLAAIAAAYGVLSLGAVAMADQDDRKPISGTAAEQVEPRQVGGFGSGTGMGPGGGAGSASSLAGGFTAQIGGAGSQTFGGGFTPQQAAGSGPLSTTGPGAGPLGR